MQDYAVIIADMKASRRLKERERYEWQLILKSAIVQINERFSDAIEAPFMITKGDEFQGVLKGLSQVNQVVLHFERLVYPLILRFGVGYGPIQKMGSKIPIEMDGPAFHRANAALLFAKKKKISVRFDTRDPEFDQWVNTIYRLISSIKKRWSETTYKRYWKYKELRTLKRVAESERVSSQAVWDSIHHSGAADVLEAERSLNEMLRLTLPDTVHPANVAPK